MRRVCQGRPLRAPHSQIPSHLPLVTRLLLLGDGSPTTGGEVEELEVDWLAVGEQETRKLLETLKRVFRAKGHSLA